MSVDELLALAARVPDLERRIAQLEAQNQRPADGPEVLTLDRAAERFGHSPATLRAWIKDGSLPASRRKVRGHWYVEAADVLARIRSMRASVAAPHRANLRSVPEVEAEAARMLSGEHKSRGGRQHG